MALQFFIQKVNFSPAPPPGRRVTGEKNFFPQNTGKSFLGILAKNRRQNKCFSWFSRHFNPTWCGGGHYGPPPTLKIAGIQNFEKQHGLIRPDFS